MENHLHRSGVRKHPRNLVFIWDRTDSYGLMPFIRNFIDCVRCGILVNDATNINRVIGIGYTLHKLINSNGKEVFLPCVSYHLNQTGVLLFSPQTYYHVHAVYYEVYYCRVSMNLTYHRIHINIDI